QPPIALLPALIAEKQISQLHQGHIGDTASGQECLNALLWGLRLRIYTHTGTVWTQANIDEGFDAVLLEQRKKFLWLPSAVAEGVTLFVHGFVSNRGASGRENRLKNCHISSEALITRVGFPRSHSGYFGPGPGQTCPAPVSFHKMTSIPFWHGP